MNNLRTVIAMSLNASLIGVKMNRSGRGKVERDLCGGCLKFLHCYGLIDPEVCCM